MGTFQWWQILGVNNDAWAQIDGDDIAIASNGDVIVIGDFIGDVAIGDTTLVNNGSSPPSNEDAYLARFDSDGGFLCAQQNGYSLNQYYPRSTQGVAIDADDNILTIARTPDGTVPDSVVFAVRKLGGGVASGVRPAVSPASAGTKLLPNVPNPFNPATTIRYELPAAGAVSLRVYDVRGNLVRTLVQRHDTAGRHDIPWDGRDDRGLAVASGVYFVRLTAGRTVQTRKVELLK